MKHLFFGLLSLLLLLNILPAHAQEKKGLSNPLIIEERVANTMDSWHRAAGNANLEDYFKLMTPNAVFIGTDATENWVGEEFKSFVKPYFDAGKAWNFTALERNIYIHNDQQMAWFDELLDTQMGICRGSGVLTLELDGWKIRHYVLSIAVPNENVEELTSLKSSFDKELIQTLQNK